MPLVQDYEETLELYRTCADANLVMARIGYSDQDQIQGVVRGAARFALEHEICHVSILPFEVRYCKRKKTSENQPNRCLSIS